MVLVRQAALGTAVLGTAVLCAAVLTGCGSAHDAGGTSDSARLSASAPASAGAVSASASPATTTTPTSSATVSPPAISIPPYLCDATDIAQNAADAYMGALSAGDEKQAIACVLPGTVASATTRSLLATVKGTAVYQPRDGVDGPSVFGYQGNGKAIDVTVRKQADGKFWIVKVTVRNA